MTEKKELNDEELENITGGNVIPIGGNYGKKFRCLNCSQVTLGSDIGKLFCFHCGCTDFEEVK